MTIIRGDFSTYPFSLVSGAYQAFSGGGAMSTLSFDGSAFTEYLNNGYTLKYKSQGGSGAIVTHQLIRVSDPSGNIHTYAYGTGAEAGLLKSIQVPFHLPSQ